VGTTLPSSIQLVPPSLKVIASLITYQQDVSIAVARAIHRCDFGVSFSMMKICHVTPIQFACEKLGHGLSLAVTRTLSDDGFFTLVWISEMACHPLCSFLGRQCQGDMPTEEWLKLIDEKHRKILETLPRG
jgi:hypothetical protein